jgi:hypothetical protein
MLADFDDINYQIKKISELIPKNNDDQSLNKIIKACQFCKDKKFINAQNLIQEITSERKKIIIYEDPEILATQLEIKSLQFQVMSLEDEKTDIEKIISKFDLDYNLKLGEIIKEILLLKTKIAKKKLQTEMNENSQKEYEKSKEDYEDFSYSHNSALLEPRPKLLNEFDLKELKKLYRMATKLCHPDKVLDEQKEAAQNIFNELKNAYEANDIDTVSSILNNLKKGIFKTKGESITEIDKLKIFRQELIVKREALEKSLKVLKSSKVFNKIPEVGDNWDSYFEKTKSEFEEILNDLKSRLIIVNDEK